MSNQVDFPVGFSETTTQNNDQDGAVFYVEWLDNNEEFPDLFTKPAEVATWELLEPNEKEEFTLVQETNDWSKINAFDLHTYLDIAEKNAETLVPLKRTIHPLWSNQKCSHEDPVNKNDGDDTMLYSDDDDLTTLYQAYKSQKKLAMRASHLSLTRNLRLYDNIMHRGIYQSATTENADENVEKYANEIEYSGCADKIYRAPRNETLIYAAHLSQRRINWPSPPDERERINQKIDLKESKVVGNQRRKQPQIIKE
jgi:hypothetical protein